MKKLENVLLWLYRVWVFLVKLSNKNASVLIVIKRLQRLICVLNYHGVFTVYFTMAAFDGVIVHPGTMEAGVNLNTARQPAIFILLLITQRSIFIYTLMIHVY